MSSSSLAWELLPADLREKVDEALRNCPWPDCKATRESVALDIHRAGRKPPSLPAAVFAGGRAYNELTSRPPRPPGRRPAKTTSTSPGASK